MFSVFLKENTKDSALTADQTSLFDGFIHKIKEKTLNLTIDTLKLNWSILLEKNLPQDQKSFDE